MNAIAIVLLAFIAMVRRSRRLLTKQIIYFFFAILSLILHWHLVADNIKFNTLISLTLVIAFLFSVGEGIRFSFKDFRIILSSGILSCVFALFGFGEVLPGGMLLDFRYFGLFGDTLAIVIIILAFYFRGKLGYIDIVLLVSYTLLTGSKTILVLLPLLVWSRINRFFKVLLPILVVPFIYSLDYGTFTLSFLTRWNGVLVAVDLLGLYPFGVGFNNSTLMFNTIYDYSSNLWQGMETEQIDSGYLRLLVEHGFLIGMLMIGLVLLRIKLYSPLVLLLLLLAPIMNYPFELTSALFPLYFYIDFSQELT